MKILVAEDNAGMRLAIITALESLGHQVVAADDGEHAWEMLAKDRSIRSVVCDWRMPQLDGLGLCRRVRKEREDYVSFILLTQEQPSRQNLAEAFRAGVDNFLNKPVDTHQLELCLHVAARVLDFTSEIRRLQSFLPICSYCKKVRDDRQYWQQIELYIGERVGTRFSHGICPDCYQKHVVPELAKLKDGV